MNEVALRCPDCGAALVERTQRAIGRRPRRAAPHPEEAEIVRRLQAGETQRQVGAAFDLNPVTVGAIARRHGITYPQAQAQAAARRGQTLQQPERDWQAQVIALATGLGFRVYHTWRSEHSVAGFPDLVLVKAPRVLFAELKTDVGKLMPAQETWLAELAQCPGVENYVWRPRDAQVVADILQGNRHVR
jgi:hypothetical protein